MARSKYLLTEQEGSYQSFCSGLSSDLLKVVQLLAKTLKNLGWEEKSHLTCFQQTYLETQGWEPTSLKNPHFAGRRCLSPLGRPSSPPEPCAGSSPARCRDQRTPDWAELPPPPHPVVGETQNSAISRLKGTLLLLLAVSQFPPPSQ